MSAIPAEDEQSSRAPGVEAAASPLLGLLVRRLDGVLDELHAMSLGALGDGDVARLLDVATAASSRVTSLQCRSAAEADRRRLSDEVGARHTAAWLAHRSRSTRAEAARLTGLATSLEHDRHAPVAEVLAAGRLRVEQAQVIVEAVDALPSRVDAAIREQARDHLLAAAADHDAKALRQLGKRILDVVAPEVGECHEARLLEQEESRAFAGVELTLVDDGHGRCHGRFVVLSHVGAMLKRHLLALANPARHTEAELRDESGEWKPLRRRLGEAFMEYVERYPADHTPQTAGVNATVVVTMTLEQLLGEHATALLDDGTRMTAGQARRLACEAGIIPAVLGTSSQPLDLGRAARLYTKAQRIAMGLRDGGCTARGCETTASGCHAHHDDLWSRGGLTDLARGRLLCPAHHRLAHDSRYVVTVHADNTITFARRQ
ncbi:DUF222 domain-containing protein [Nocardia sp. N13]|uniref:HNH endonuclease signature motif containing protein n=1 Tax=Nocardioides sp. N13(2025) TaxID=3453405 RepID=UPI003F758F29